MAKEIPSVLGKNREKVEPKVEEALAPAPEKFFRVVKTSQVPRGASSFTLPQDKVISSRGYDISSLRAMGVPLEEVAQGGNPPRATVAP